MKLLTGLAIAQFVLIVLLFVRVLGLEAALDERGNAPPPVSGRPTASLLAPRNQAPVASLDEEQLRSIIREELAANRPADAGMQPVARSANPPRDAAYDYRLDEVRQSLDFYAQTGRITEQEMAKLQTEIANLHPEDRDAMLRRLVRELNTGAIEGRL